MKKIYLLFFICMLLFALACGKRAGKKDPVRTGDYNDELSIAMKYEDEGYADKAIQIYKKLVKSDPYNVNAIERLYIVNRQEGERLFSEGNFKEAITYLEVGFRYYKDEDLKKMFIDSVLYIEENTDDVSKSLNYLNKVLKYDENNVRALSKAASLYENVDPEKAIDLYVKIMKINPEDDSLKIKLSKLYQITGNSEKGTELLTAVSESDMVSLSDQDHDFYIKKAEQLYNEKDYANSIKIYKLLLDNTDNQEERAAIGNKLIKMYFYTTRFGNVLHIYDTVENIDIKDEETRYIILMSSIEFGKKDLFLNRIEEFNKEGLYFDDLKKNYLFYKYYISTGDEKSINDTIEKIKEIADSEYTAKIYRETSLYYAEKKQFKKALDYINMELKTFDSAEAWFNRGIFLERIKEFRKGLDAYTKAVDRDAENPKYRYYRILSLKRNRDYEQMEKEKEFVLSKFRGSKWANYVEKIFGETDLAGNVKMFSDVDSYYNYGLEYARNGDFEKAVYNFKLASNMQPENFNILVNIGNVFYAMGRYSESVVYYMASENYSENNSYVKFFMGKSLIELGLYSRAYNYIKESFELDPENEEAKDILRELADKRSLELPENQIEGLKQIGIAGFNEEFYDISYLFFKKAYDINNDDIFILTSITNVLLKKELADEASKYIDKVMLLYPDEFETNKLYFNYLNKTNRKESIEHIKDMAERFPEERWIYEQLISIYKETSDNSLSDYIKNVYKYFSQDEMLINELNSIGM